MILTENKAKIITGFYGVGKTEFCVNLALSIRAVSDERVSIADFDIINTYFRSREKSEFLKKRDISILGNLTNNTTNQDIPAISGNVIAPLVNNEYIIIDLAGSINGLKVLPTFAAYLKNLDFLMVLNPYRPPCDNFDNIKKFITEAQHITGYPINGLVNNTNFIRETSSDNYRLGTQTIIEYSEKLNLPISYSLVRADIFAELNGKVPGDAIILSAPIMREQWY